MPEATRQPHASSFADADRGGAMPVALDRRLPPLVAAAVAVGRMRGEPAAVIAPFRRPGVLGRLFGMRKHRPLGDARLEVLRAISAAVASGRSTVRRDLMAAAFRVGWKPDDLRIIFPTAIMPRLT